MKGRIIYVSPTSKVIGLSLHRPLLENKAHDFGDMSVGDIVQEGTVVHVEPQVGVVLNIDENGLRGFAHVSESL